MNNCIIVTQTSNGLVVVASKTSSTTNSGIVGVSTFIEGTIGYEMYKELVA